MHKVKHRALSFAYPEKFQDVVRNIDLNPVTEKRGFRHYLSNYSVYSNDRYHLVMEMLAGLRHHSEKLNLRGGTV